jgi:hypothetical protein
VAAGSLEEALDAVLPAYREPVRSALAAVLGATPIVAITPLAGGLSAGALLRVEAGDRRYVVRIEGPHSPLRNPQQYTSLRIAAEAGIGPRLHYVDEANGVAVTDFIEQRPLRDYPGGPPALAQAVGGLAARLQATPVFPFFVDYPVIVRRLFAHIGRTGLFAAGLLDRHFEHLERLSVVYAAEPPVVVSSHNDPVPGNILFDGTRLWLIDWESAYRNDPLVDVAIVLDNLAPSPELEEVLLQSWLGRAPHEAMRARLALVRALTRLYYAGVFLSASATRPRAMPEHDLSAPTLAEFESAIRAGRLTRGTPETTHVMGKMYLNGFLTGAAVPALGTP